MQDAVGEEGAKQVTYISRELLAAAVSSVALAVAGAATAQSFNVVSCRLNDSSEPEFFKVGNGYFDKWDARTRAWSGNLCGQYASSGGYCKTDFKYHDYWSRPLGSPGVRYLFVRETGRLITGYYDQFGQSKDFGSDCAAAADPASAPGPKVQF